MKNALTLIIVFCLIFGATLGCKNNALSKIKEPQSKCAADLPKLDSAAQYAERGNRETTDGNYECGLDDCQKALDLDSKNVDALLCRGYIYKQRSEIILAEKDFNEAVRLDPENSIVYSQRGQLYKQIKELDKALADINRAIELTPAHFYYERRAGIYVELEDYENAVKDYTEAIRQRPETEDYYKKRAEVYRELGKKDLAEADEEKRAELKRAKK